MGADPVSANNEYDKLLRFVPRASASNTRHYQAKAKLAPITCAWVSLDLSGVRAQWSGESGWHCSNLAEHTMQVAEFAGPADNDVGAPE